MKKIKIIIIVVGVLITTSASAQFESPRLSKSFNSLYIQWNPSKFIPSEGDNKSFTGFTLGYNHDFRLVSNVPLFIELGAALQYSYKTNDEYFDIDKFADWGLEGVDNRKWTEKASVFSIKVPISILYKHYFPNSNVAIAPYAGIDVRGNIFGKYKIDVNMDLKRKIDAIIKSVTTATSWSPIPESKEYDLFSKKDMGDDAVWKRFQFGWHIGVNVYFSSFYAGVSYGADFTEISKDCKIRTISATIGYEF